MAIYCQNGKVSPDVHHMSLGDGYQLPHGSYPRMPDAASCLLSGMLLMILQLDLAAGSLWAGSENN